MLPRRDLATAAGWAKLGERIGWRSSHGTAHLPDADAPHAWRKSGFDDFLAVKAALGLGPNDPIRDVAVDFGCGAGRLIPFFAEECSWVFAVDTCSKLIESFERLWPNVSSVSTELPALAAPEGSVDVVAAVHVLYSFTPTGLHETVQQLAGLLAPGGALVLDVPAIGAGCRHEDPDPDGLPGGWWLHSTSTIAGAALDAGLDVERRPPLLTPAATWPDLAPVRLWTLRRPR